MLRAILQRYRIRAANVPAQTTEEKTLDITVRNSLSGKFTNFFKVDSQLSAILCACGLAQPYAKPQPAPPATRFWIAASQHTGAIGLHYRKASGEVIASFNPAISKEKLEAAWGTEIPAPVWDALLNKSKFGTPTF